METNKRILLYGNSLILGSIGASLQRFSQFKVTKLVPSVQDSQKLDAAKTDILLFSARGDQFSLMICLVGTPVTKVLTTIG